MKRRALLAASGAWLAAAALHSLAQAPKAPRRIAFMHPASEGGYRAQLESFRTSLRAFGYVEGSNIAIDVRWGNDKSELLHALAAETVALKPEVIVTATTAGIMAVSKATSSIPIVFATAANPVEQGFVKSLRRPGGNITGIIVHTELTSKIVEIAREALPAVRRLALLIHETDPAHKFGLDAFEPNARRFNFEPIVVRVSRAEDFDRAFREIAEKNAHALVVPTLALFTSRRNLIIERAQKARLPLLSGQSQITESGGLLSYGTVIQENFQRAAVMVDKILRGAKPGDLPVEQPAKFELVVNMKTAKAIGVKLSPTTMLRATSVIE